MIANAENILISLDSRHARNIYAGSKRVELRRRTMHVEPGTTVWIYEKVPAGAITGSATVVDVLTAPPEQLWDRYGPVSGLTKKEFFAYFDGLALACAVVLENAQHLPRPLALAALREAAEKFHPPQFFIRLFGNHPVLAAVQAHRRNKKKSATIPTKSCISALLG